MSSRSLVRKDPVTDPERTGIIGTGYGAGLIISSAARLTRWLRMPRIRRRLDAVTGAILSGFGVRLGTET